MFFFFQAEDGIRDLYVTGVQTCALPISLAFSRDGQHRQPVDERHHHEPGDRSEERRVGKSVDLGGRRIIKKKKKKKMKRTDELKHTHVRSISVKTLVHYIDFHYVVLACA